MRGDPELRLFCKGVILPLCMDCVHLFEDGESLCCKAFPMGIPEPILYSEVDHDQPYPGDGGIMFEPVAKHLRTLGT